MKIVFNLGSITFRGDAVQYVHLFAVYFLGNRRFHKIEHIGTHAGEHQVLDHETLRHREPLHWILRCAHILFEILAKTFPLSLLPLLVLRLLISDGSIVLLGGSFTVT